MRKATAVALGVALSAAPVLTVSTSAFALATGDAVPAASEPSVNDFLAAAAQVKVLVNGKEYKDFDYMKGIDATKLLTTKKAEVSYPMHGGTAIPDNAKVTLANVPSDFAKYITSKDVASGTDVVAKASGYTITYHFNYKRTSTAGTTKKGDVNKDGKYDVKDLAGVKATVDGKTLDAFRPDQSGPYRIASGAKVELSGVPAGWTAKAKSNTAGVIITVSDPDGKDVIGYTFAETSTPSAPSDPGKTDETVPLAGFTDEEKAYLTGVFKVLDAGVQDDTANIFDASKTLYLNVKGAAGQLIRTSGNIPSEDALFSYTGVNGKTQTGHKTTWYKDGVETNADDHDTEVLTFTGTESGKTVSYTFTTLDHDPFKTTPSDPGKTDDADNGSAAPSTPSAPSGDDAAAGQDSTKTVDVPTAAQSSDTNLAETGVGAESLLAVMAAVAVAGGVMGVRRRIAD